MRTTSRTSIVLVLVAAVCTSAFTAAGTASGTEPRVNRRAAPLGLHAVGLTGPVTGPVTGRVTARLPLGRTAPGALTVLDANVAEYLDVADNRQPRDLTNFARRARDVLAAQEAAGRRVAAPDLVFLQEVNRRTAVLTARRLRAVFHRAYRIAGGHRYGPAPGRGAILRGRTRRHALLTRATSVLYNTSTMNRPTQPRLITFAYPKAQMWTPGACRRSKISCQAGIWESRQSAIFRFTSKRKPHRAYAVASIHFEPYPFLRPRLHRTQPPGFRQALWFRQLAATVTRAYPHARQVLAGDFNDYLCGHTSASVGQPLCDAMGQFTPLFRNVLAAPRAPRYHAAIGSGIDHIFTPGRVVAAGKDMTYKLPARKRAHGRIVRPALRHYLTRHDYATRFATAAGFDRCNALFSAGAGLSRAAHRIPGCVERYYSDHPLDWAVLR